MCFVVADKAFKSTGSTYILLDVLLCSIAEYFYELCRILYSFWALFVLYEVQLDNKVGYSISVGLIC